MVEVQIMNTIITFIVILFSVRNNILKIKGKVHLEEVTKAHTGVEF
jgi:hypothetical protein